MKQILPRLKLRENDSRLGQYPAKSRIGDRSRTGRNLLSFDDTIVQITTESLTVSFPSMLEISSSQLQSQFTSSIVSTGLISSYLNSQFQTYRTQEENIQPYFEDFTQLTTKDSTYSATGTPQTSVGFGFSAPIQSKTRITLEFDIGADFNFNAIGGETALLTPLSSSITSIQIESNTAAGLGNFNAPNSLDAPTHFNRTGSLFDPFGDPACTFTTVFDPYGFSQNQFSPDQFFTQFSLNNKTSFGNTFNLSSKIDRPFLVEKVTFEVPLKAGPGWTGDRTGIYAGTTDAGTPSYICLDSGGPAITVALAKSASLYSDKFSNYEWICSGTIIPRNDATASIQYAKIEGGLSSFSESIVRFPVGFNFFSKESAIVDPDMSGFFTGTVSVEAVPQSHCGIRSMYFRTFYPGGTPISASLATGSYYSTSQISSSKTFSIIGIGRDFEGLSSGRSYFGKDYLTPNYSSELANRSVWNEASGPEADISLGAYTSDVVVWNQIATQPSPYIVYPQDELSLFFSKCASAITGVDGSSNYYRSSSHDVSISQGRIKIHFYGSIVSDEKEYHDTLNENLTSFSVYETIGTTKAEDQFLPFRFIELSGSYTSPIFTGSLLQKDSNGNYITGTRKHVYHNYESPSFTGLLLNFTSSYFPDTKKKLYEVQKRNKNIRLNSSEKLWDTLVNVEANYEVGVRGSDPFILRSYGKMNIFPYSGTSRNISNNFIQYTLGPDQLFASTDKIILKLFDIGYASTSSTTTYTPVRKDEFYKNLYGYFPDVNDIAFSEGFKYFRSASFISFDNALISSKPQGWLYGLYSGNEDVRTHCIYRRNSFGQIRDMLEQREYTKFYDETGELKAPVQASFYDLFGNPTDAERTTSSNLSQECTSSIPFFEGRILNREDPIDTTKLNLFNVIP